jgi:hypothetical protein
MSLNQIILVYIVPIAMIVLGWFLYRRTKQVD